MILLNDYPYIAVCDPEGGHLSIAVGRTDPRLLDCERLGFFRQKPARSEIWDYSHTAITLFPPKISEYASQRGKKTRKPLSFCRIFLYLCSRIFKYITLWCNWSAATASCYSNARSPVRQAARMRRSMSAACLRVWRKPSPHGWWAVRNFSLKSSSLLTLDRKPPPPTMPTYKKEFNN